MNKVQELQTLIDGINLKQVSYPRGVTSLHELYLEKGKEQLAHFVENGSITNDEEETNIIAIRPKELMCPEDNTNKGVEDTGDFSDERDAYQEKNKRVNDTEDTNDIRTEKLKIINTQRLRFEAKDNHYDVLGALDPDFASMRVTLLIEEKLTRHKERSKLDLYERTAVYSLSMQLAELFSQSQDDILSELRVLTELLEQYREQLLQEAQKSFGKESDVAEPKMTSEELNQAMAFLKEPELIKNLNEHLEHIGIVGEEASRMLLFIIASTYKMGHPLHALVQGTSGSGKSHLLNTIGKCMPPEDVLSMTRVTSKSFYHYGKNDLVNKLMLIQDFDGLDEEAQYAFRELQSAGMVSSSTTYKDRNGNLISSVKTVKSHFASILATTRAEVYYDNMSRSIVIGVDESQEQTLRIIHYHNKRLSGVSDDKQEKKSLRLLQNVIRCLKTQEVINPYAHKVQLPVEAKMLRRLNNHYQSFVKQVTLLHQYQRTKNNKGALVATKEDLKIASEILFDAIMLKVDELDSSLRQFFDSMKTFVEQKAKEQAVEKDKYSFMQRDIRMGLNASKSSCFRYMEDLEQLEYVQKTGGYANRGFKYRIVFWDDMQSIRKRIQETLQAQLDSIEEATTNVVNSGSQQKNHHDSDYRKETALVVQQSTDAQLSEEGN
jgi:energy-coupling factor transporter ATP-binding protein EcfA2